MATGLDLTDWFPDIQRIVYSKFSDAPMDPDDLVQEVCRKIYKANQGTSPYDPDRSSPSRYICMVARSVVGHHLEKMGTNNPCWSPHRIVQEDKSAEDPTKKGNVHLEGFSEWLKHELGWEDTMPRRVHLLMEMGYKRSEIASILNRTPRNISYQRTRLKRLLRRYVEVGPRLQCAY